MPIRRSAAQIRRLSVKKVVNPIARDNLGNALPGSLLDPAMGPTEPHASCVCALRAPSPLPRTLHLRPSHMSHTW